MYSSRGMVLAWAVILTAYVAGWVTASAALILLPHFAAPVLAIVGYSRARSAGDSLRRSGWYRFAVGLLVATATLVVVTAGSTVLVAGDGHGRVLGLIGMASTNVLVIVLGWRALTRPSARRAALLGALAVTVEPIALVADVVVNLWSFDPSRYAIAVWGTLAATWIGALVCMAALTSFRYAPSQLPAARVVGAS